MSQGEVQPAIDGLGDEEFMGPAPLAAIAAAHVVLSGQREATRLDLLLSTIVEVLATGPVATKAVAEAVRAAWPAAGTTEVDVRSALELGCRSHRLFLRTDGLEGELWRLDEAGSAEADTSRAWAADLRRRAVTEMQRRAQSDFRPCTEAEASLWVDRLTSSLTAGVIAAEDAFLGGVDISTASIRPKTFDRTVVLGTIADDVREDVGEFLAATALATLDPADPFGIVLLSNIATSAVLHGHLARLDAATESQILGPLTGQEALLDTPVLLALLSGQESRDPLEEMLTASRDAGVSVLLLEHYLEELQDVVDATADTALADEPLLSDPHQRAAYIALAEYDDVIMVYARARADELVLSWSDFAAQTHQLRRRLAALGVEVRPHGNADRDQVAGFRAALAGVLASDGRRRAPQAIERDAHTLTLVYRHRRRFRRENRDTVWPGAFVITYDKRLSPAYAQIDPDHNGTPVTLTPSLFTMLLARVRPVPEVAALTEAAGRMLTREIAERVAVKYPPRVAAELAAQLGGAHGGGTDVRVAQFESVRAVVEEAESGEVASEVLRRRIMRQRAATEHSSVVAASERAATDEYLAAANDRQAELEGWRKNDAGQLAAARAESEQLRTKLEQQLSPDDVHKLGVRATVRGFALAVDLALVILFFAAGFEVTAGLVLIAGILLWWQTTPWTKDPTVSLRTAAPSILANTLAITSFLVDIWR